MKIETFILAWNEERLISYTMRHYSQFSDVVILSNNTTDNQNKIAKSLGAKVWEFNMPDVIDNQWYIDLKDNIWKVSLADWVIVVDADEFVYHPNIVGILENTQATIFKPQLFNMFSENFPVTQGQIYEEVTDGIEGGAKVNLFRPKEIKEINYAPGCHSSNPEGNLIWGTEKIKTLHFRNLGKDYIFNRNKIYSVRRCENDKKNGWAIHYVSSDEETGKWFDDNFALAEKII
jgi:hypothetical protein